jgi:hypothetical protein
LKRHKELAQKYRVLFLGYSVEVEGLLSPVLFLGMIMKDPDMTFYPKVVQLLEYSHDQSDQSDDEDEREESNSFEGREKEEGIVKKWEGFEELIKGKLFLIEMID